MMVLILIVCGVVLFFFAKTYRKEMAERREREAQKAAEKARTAAEAAKLTE